jgi:hypothetical protein
MNGASSVAVGKGDRSPNLAATVFLTRPSRMSWITALATVSCVALKVFSLINDAHAAAQLLDDAVMGDGLANRLEGGGHVANVID